MRLTTVKKHTKVYWKSARTQSCFVF